MQNLNKNTSCFGKNTIKNLFTQLFILNNNYRKNDYYYKGNCDIEGLKSDITLLRQRDDCSIKELKLTTLTYLKNTTNQKQIKINKINIKFNHQNYRIPK